MTNLQAALGVAQTERLDEMIRIKRRIGRRYDELLADVDLIQRPLARTNYADNIYWVYGLVLKDEVGSTPGSHAPSGGERDWHPPLLLVHA
jgi:perosamine synthetase